MERGVDWVGIGLIRQAKVKTGILQGFNSGTTISYVQGYMTLYPSLSTGLPNSITISYVSSTNVQGTFSATLSGSALGVSPTAHTITNGKFNIKSATNKLLDWRAYGTAFEY